jgi:sulfite reductase (NADPH) flavoprotein alpha-component
MSSPVRVASLLPETAPFTPEQRIWLDGLFAGLLALDGSITPLSAQDAAALLSGLPGCGPPPAPAEPEDDGAPWHDPALPLVDRMKLAEGRPLPRRLMAAMAQQDCGQCGYNCADYSKALFLKKEERLNLCVPGGKETARMLKALYSEVGAAAAPTQPAIVARAPTEAAEAVAAPAAEAVGEAKGSSRDHPVEASFLSRTRLNKEGSEKETYHVEFDLGGSGLDYAVGDSFGIFPRNDSRLVDAVIKTLDVPADFPIGGRAFRDVLTDGVSLGTAPDMLFQLFSYISGGERRQKAKALSAGGDPDGDAATIDVLAAIEKFPGIRPDPEAFVESLDPIQPRLYSIACSPKVSNERLSLTVDAVRYAVGKRTRLGLASTYLADRIAPGDRLRCYIQKAHAFGLPADPSVPIIMIGPGTGVAPFRAFLQERRATKAPGRNWLFFGHQRSAFDFFYKDEMLGMRASGLLARLTLAWSRDGDQKIYVQDRMREVGRDLWSWIDAGSRVYVCGDAQRMAKDVERALVDVVAAHGARPVDRAIAFVADMKKSGRYQTDVY